MSHPMAPIDFAALIEMLGGKREVVASLLSTFLEELVTDVDASKRAVLEQTPKHCSRSLTALRVPAPISMP